MERKKEASFGSTWNDFTLSSLDILMWKIEEKEWEYLGNIGATDTNAVVTIQTNLIQNISMEAKGQIILPKIMDSDILHFKKTEVGSIQQGYVTIHN